MATYNPPSFTEPLTTFNPSDWGVSNDEEITTAYLDANYCQFPTAQGTMNFSNVNLLGNSTLNLGTSKLVQGLGTNKNNISLGAAGNLASIITSQNNVCVGNNLGQALTTGNNNRLIGLDCGSALTSGNNNVYIGRNNGVAKTTGDFDVGLGLDVLTGSANENSRIAIGYEAGKVFGAGSSGNVAIGEKALKNATTGIKLNAIGFQAGRDITTGAENTLFGYNSGIGINTGSFNVCMGNISGFSIGAGQNNTAIGFSSLVSIAGSNSTAVGSFALASGGDGNTAVGANALRNCISGAVENTAVGLDAGRATTSGQSNTFVGKGAGIANTTGGGNLMVGADAGKANTTGSRNILMGVDAGNLFTTANDNTLIGYNTAIFHNTGDANTFLGGSSGSGAASTTSYNTYVGFKSGFQSLGGGNTYVGHNDAAAGSYSGTNNSGLGRNAYNDANVSYSTSIGSDTHSYESNQILLGRITGEDNVDVAGILRVSSATAPIALDGTDKLLVRKGGIFIDCLNNAGTYTELGLRFFGNANSVNGGADIRCLNGDMTLRARGSTATRGDLVFENSSSGAVPTEKMIIKNDGKVGIGISAPTAQLELSLDSAKKPTTTTWTISSDMRVKKDIVDADIDMCYNVSKNLKLRRFKWDEKYMRTSDLNVIGFIAQEVAEVFPKCVSINEKTFVVGKEVVKEVVKDVVKDVVKEVVIDVVKDVVKEVVIDVVDGVEVEREVERVVEREVEREVERVVEREVEREEEKEVDIVETIADFRSLNADQLYKNMWGTIAKLIEKVETLEAEVKFLKEREPI